MGIQIRPYTPELVPLVCELNQRLRAGRVPFSFSESPVPRWLPKTKDGTIYQEYFVALEDSSVRGGYVLKQQRFCFQGHILPVAAFQTPISEGAVNNRYGLVAIQLVKDAQKKQPLVYALGMVGSDTKVARMYRSMGWTVQSVPLYFKVKHGYRFLRNIAYLRRHSLARIALDAAAFSGAGWLGAKIANLLQTRHEGRGASILAETVDRFSDWADWLWSECKDNYSMLAVRESCVLNVVYPPGGERFIRLKVTESDRIIGWAVVLQTTRWHEYFGKMHVGSIIDCLALPENAGKVIGAAARVLEREGVDLIVSNQNHPAWRLALRHAGFMRGPSTLFLGISKELGKLLDRDDPDRIGIHVNRGDGIDQIFEFL